VKELPSGWQIKRFEDVAKIQSGSGFPKKYQGRQKEKYPFFKVSDMNLPGNNTKMFNTTNTISTATRLKLKSKLFPSNSIIFPKVGGAIATNKKRLTTCDCCVDNNIMGLLPKTDIIDSDFLYHFINSIDLLDLSNRSNPPSIRQSTVKDWNIPLPFLQEQKRIVAILDEAFAGIDQAAANTEKNLANAREVFESYLNGIFTQKGTGWADKKLSEILETQPRNGWSPPAKHHSDQGTPVVTLSSVTGFEFNLSKIKFTSAPVKPEAHYWLENGALLITRSNTPELVGHVAVCSGLNEPIIYPDLIMKMMVDKDLADTRFIYYQLRSRKLREVIMNSAKGANPTMKKINKEVVQGLPMSLPSLRKQREITSRIDALAKETQHLESIYQKKLNALAELKQSILHKAFTGELTHSPEQELVEVC